MGLRNTQKSLAELHRLQHFKQTSRRETPALGEAMVQFFEQSVAKRQTKLGKIAECWAALVPQTLLEHSSLEALVRGTLTVLVDTASHLYEIKQLLLAGLQEQLLLACKSTGLRKITLKPGRWYDGAAEQKKPRF